jgi:O-antigen/teichoic acid export membrane protein
MGYRLARGTFWSMAGAIISKGLGIVSSVIVARTLGRVEFGELAILSSTVAMFQLFAGFGLGLTATKHVAEHRQHDPQRAGQIIAMAWIVTAVTGALCSVLLYALAPWLAANVLAAPHLSGLLRITALALLISAVNAAQGGTLSGFEAFKSIAVLNLVAGILNVPLMVAGVLLAGLEGAAWAIVASCAVNWVLSHLAIRRQARQYHIPLRFTGCSREFPLLWRFSLPTVLGGMMVTPVSWACYAMLVNQPNGYSEMGIYNAANQWRTAVLFVPGAIGTVVLPILSSLTGAKDRSRYLRVLRVSILVNGLVALAVSVPIGILSVPIMSIYGEGFGNGWLTLILLLISGVLISVNNVVGHALVSTGHLWVGLLFNLMWAAVLLLTTYWWVQEWLATGLALAAAVAYVAHSVWQGIYVWRVLAAEGISCDRNCPITT